MQIAQYLILLVQWECDDPWSPKLKPTSLEIASLSYSLINDCYLQQILYVLILVYSTISLFLIMRDTNMIVRNYLYIHYYDNFLS